MDFFQFNRSFQDIMAQNKIWDILEQSEVPKVYPKNQIIYLQGETAEKFYYLKKGSVKIFLSSENGTEKTLTLLEHGDLFGEAAFFDGLPRVSSAKTLEKSEILTIGAATLLDCFSREPMLAMKMLQFLARTIRMLSAQVDGMTFLQADKRIALLLLQQAEKSQETPPVIPITQEELGSLAGCTRVTVSRALNDFVQQGWIVTKYRRVVLTDRNALAKFAIS